MMTRPKINSLEKRIIIYLSYPKGASVNAGILKGFYLGQIFNFTLPTINTLADRLLVAGAGSWLWTADLSRAYSQLQVCPLSSPLLGIALGSNIYLDITPPFGSRTLALACAHTTRALVWLLRQERYFSLYYLDDFVGIESFQGKGG